MSQQVAILQEPTSHGVNVVTTPNVFITINGVLIDVEGSTGEAHQHGLVTYIDVFETAQQSFVSINGMNILQINDTGSVCGSSIVHVKDDKSLQNFIYIG